MKERLLQEEENSTPRFRTIVAVAQRDADYL